MAPIPNFISGLLAAVSSVITHLPQSFTNGKSTLGTFDADIFDLFLKDNSLIRGYPWGTLTADKSNPYSSTPVTGVVRSYDWTLSRGQLAPDGYLKDMILINGQFPGPTIEANWGDTIQVTVHNNITGPGEGTGIHWHGLLQQATPWMDGIPSVHQCPIAPGASFTYSFQADLYGTSFYHSHYSAQYTAGVLGPMIIHGPSSAPYDIDLGPVLLTDWYHRSYIDILDDVMGTDMDKVAVLSDNNMINGKMNFDCSTVSANDTTQCANNAGISKFKLTRGKTHRLRLMNGGAEAIQRFSIDGHTMTVIANDFVPVVPYMTNVVTLAAGQRTDVLVTADIESPTSSFWMRSNVSELCSLTNQGKAVAAVYYDDADTTKTPTSQAWPYTETACDNDDLSLTVPFFPMNPTLLPATTKVMEINSEVNASGNFLWTMNGQSFRGDYNQPVLSLAKQGIYEYEPEWAVQDFGSSSSIRIVINNPTTAAHPMHLHGHDMYIMSSGPGDWDGVSFNRTINPQRRDVFIVPPSSHVVFQFDGDNPGVWPFHCHIAWHASSGLYQNFLERPWDVAQLNIPESIQQTCRDWSNWESTGVVVDQIDSGL